MRPHRQRHVNAGQAARRSASSEGGGDRHRASAERQAGRFSPQIGATPAPRRRRFRPSSTAIFLGASGVLAAVFDAATILRRARRGPWRAEVAEGSMMPALLPGDWLLLDPTCRRWPRPGTIVVIREPGTGILAIKRVAARGARRGRAAIGGDAIGRDAATGEEPAAPGPDGPRRLLGSREAWLLGDAADGSVDSRAYGPLDADALVARAWFRYGPVGRFGLLR